MSHLGKQEPDIQTVLTNANVLADGQVIMFAEGIALSGVVKDYGFGDRRGVAVVRSDNGEIGGIIHASGMQGIMVGGDSTTGMVNEFAGAQVGFFWNNQRVFYINNAGINLQEKEIQQVRKSVGSDTDGGNQATQSTGGLTDNIGATGVITFNMIETGARGHVFEYFNTAGFPIRLNPGAANHFITATGVMADAQHLELTSVGAYVKVVKNTPLDWMVIGQLGDVNPL